MKAKLNILLVISLLVTYSSQAQTTWWHTSGQFRTGIPSGGFNGASANNGSLLFYNTSSTNTVSFQSDTVTTSYTMTLPKAQGASNTVLTNNGSGKLSWQTAAGIGAWSILGNSGTSASTNFIGTTDNVDFVVRTNNTEKMRVLAGGNVGIGTTAPFGKLNVVGTSYMGEVPTYLGTAVHVSDNTFFLTSRTAPAINVGTSITLCGRYTAGDYGNLQWASIVGAKDNSTDASSTGFMALYTNAGNNPTEKMRILAGGNVGIGTAAPANALQVYNAAATQALFNGYSTVSSSAGTAKGAISIGNVTSYQGLIDYDDASVTHFTIKNTYSSSLAQMNFAMGSVGIAMTILGGGNVGIGTTGPNYKLDVSGDERVTGLLGVGGAPNASYALYVSGSAYSTDPTGWHFPSDMQLKKDTSSFTDGLNVIKKIHPINYRYNGKAGIKDTTTVFTSVVAQQLQAIAPYAVKPYSIRLNDINDTTETPSQVLSITTEPLLFACINAIKELAKNDSIKDVKIDTLQTKDFTLVAKLQTQDSIIQAMHNQMTQCCQINSTPKMMEASNDNQKTINDSLMKEIETLKKQMTAFSQSLEQCCFNYQQNTSTVNSITKNSTSNGDIAQLEQNIPNPFSESTSIRYYVPSNIKTTNIIIKTLDGKELKNFVINETGFGQILISGSTFANGTYICEMITDGKLAGSNKMMLTK